LLAENSHAARNGRNPRRDGAHYQRRLPLGDPDVAMDSVRLHPPEVAMNVLAASVVVLSCLPTSLASDAYASDGTIYFSGEIVLSTIDPLPHAPRAADGPVPIRSTALRPLPVETQFELLDYFADYMSERGTARTQLSMKTDAYE
jgi:hypothetical protein